MIRRDARPIRGDWYVQALPWFLLVAGLGCNLATPPSVTFTPIYAASPLVAAALLSFRATALNAAVTTLAVSAMLMMRRQYEEQSLLEILTVLTVGLLALVINLVLIRRGRQLASARTISDAVQRAIVPEPPARLGGLLIATRYRASRREHQVGGDLYAVVDTPHGVRLILGDVRGKGLEATESVAVVLGAFREAAETEPDLSALADRLDAALARAARLSSSLDRAEKFVTAMLAQVTRERPDGPARLFLLNRGHPPPLLLTAQGEVFPLDPDVPELPLGMELATGQPSTISPLVLPPGATVLFYTDGMTEARNRKGQFYDPSSRLRGATFDSPQRLLDWLLRDVTRYERDTDDDMALLALRFSEPAIVVRRRDGER